MNRKLCLIFLLCFVLLFICKENHSQSEGKRTMLKTLKTIVLPKPVDNAISLLDAIKLRKSERNHNASASITLQELSNLLYAAQGITHDGLRSVPSAGALYPLEVYLICNNVTNLVKGLYHFDVKNFKLELISKGDYSKPLFEASLTQSVVKKCAVSFIITAVWKRITNKYGDRGKNYAYVEAGHVGQNILLMATALNLKSVPIGAFFDDKLSRLLQIDGVKHTPIYQIPVGK